MSDQAIERPDLASIRVLVYPDKGLRQRAQDLTQIDGFLNELTFRMGEMLLEHEGIGLAATQIGWPYRFIIVNPSFQKGKHIPLINPVIVERKGIIEVDEGCLSVPEIRTVVRRAAYVKVRATLLNGKEAELEGEDLVARLFQHEIDHLDGRLFVDRTGPDDRARITRRLKELARSGRKQS